ncbi:MAG: tRNA (adenosine(37)-N6)-dimethylallyltransferase MiaA [Pseudomonadota bacterium]
MAAAHSNLPPCLVISGPTASGKTELAMRLADRWPIDLISVDSAQVYEGMNVGSAKPDRETLKHYPHALIDIRPPHQSYSAADFVRDASELIHQSCEEGRLPVLVGGTTLYLKALRYGLDDLPPADQHIRAELKARGEQGGWPALHLDLARVDPTLAVKIRPNDPQRIIRALELHQLTGQAPSALMSGRGPDRMPTSVFMVVTATERSSLHARINQRWSRMVELGLREEVEQLLDTWPGDAEDLGALRAVGYRQTVDHLRGHIDRAQWLKQGAAATRQLAKRQLTALRQWSGALWYDPWIVDTMGAGQLNSECFARINKQVAALLG